MEKFLTTKKIPKTILGWCSIYLYLIFSHFKFVDKHLWQPYLSLPFQELNPSQGLNLKPKTWSKIFTAL